MEMQIRSTVTYHLTPVSMATAPQETHQVTTVGEDEETIATSGDGTGNAGEAKWWRAMENSTGESQKVKNRVTVVPS